MPDEEALLVVGGVDEPAGDVVSGAASDGARRRVVDVEATDLDDQGADEPYAKRQRALRAEVDEEAWASLYRTRSRPFPLPETGKIAVKVVNHYGDEVLQVYDVR